MTNCYLIMLYVLYKQLSSPSNDVYVSRRTYPCIIFLFFFHTYNYVVIDSGYREVSSYVGGFDPGGA